MLLKMSQLAVAVAAFVAAGSALPAHGQVPGQQGLFAAVDGRWMFLGGDRVENGAMATTKAVSGPGGQVLIGFKFDPHWDAALAGGVQQLLSDLTFFRNGRLSVDTNRQNIDLEVGYSSGNWRFSAGLRGIHYNQVVAYNALPLQGADTRDLWGIGPKVGAGASFPIDDNFAVVGGVDAALVFARFADYGTGAIVGNGSYWQFVPQVGGEIAVSWRPDDSPGLAVTVGGRIDAWFNTVMTAGDGVGRGTLLTAGPFIRLAYNFSGPNPRLPVAAPPSDRPAAARAPSHVVFFDFDSSALTVTARGVIQQAANDARAGRATNVGVTGHADRAGDEAYNLALSLRRAEAVKAELMRNGIAAQQIVVAGRGETQPLVATADGVREPQNRRVTISF